jgi:radical SAM superfamily enzyme YgiQ (UPF0313 family)
MGDVVLLSTYELGRQPFGLASPAAWLKRAGATVTLQDLSVSRLDEESVLGAILIGIYVPMHTATRLAEPVLARVRLINPHAHVCVYGLYAPMNGDHLRRLGADSIIGGEFEEPLAHLYDDLLQSRGHDKQERNLINVVSTARQDFLIPDRTGLPALQQYAGLQVAPDRVRTVGYTEASRGCKHLCRHCPIVPVYEGRFRVVQADTVLADVRQQVAAGAEHITFGDPDFLNAPAHAVQIVTRVHDEFPDLSYDATIKVEHLRKRPEVAGVLKDTGCVLVTTAVESLDDGILVRLDKGHTVADVDAVLRLLRNHSLTPNPTFVAFTPWTTLRDYAAFLRAVASRDLVDLISPIQYGIRLLIPAGSRILELDDVRPLLGDFDPRSLAYTWANPDPSVDELQRKILTLVRAEQRQDQKRREIFTHVWQATADVLAQEHVEVLPAPRVGILSQTAPPPQITEPWYCCAEPTDEQLARL